jgi:hypothetical protein
MPRRLTIVVSQGQSAAPDKRRLEEELVAGLLHERGLEVTVVPHLYDLAPDGTGMLCLQSIPGDMVVLSWLYPRAAHWTLDRHGVRGRLGQTLLRAPDDDSEEDEDQGDPAAQAPPDDASSQVVGPRDLPDRAVYHLDLRWFPTALPYLEEIRRLARESTVQTVSLGSLAAAPPAGAAPVPAAAAADDGLIVPGGPIHVSESPGRRWYPVIDYSRCTNCMECIDFCLFGVYGVDRAETILVEQPDNCRKGCPACSRVCPENAILFPQHKSPGIAGSPSDAAGGLKIDLSQLFGAPTAIEVAARERDVELVAVGRDAVGLSVGIPRRQSGQPAAAKDDLDGLLDSLDELAL